MSDETLSTELDYATVEQNTAGEVSTVVEWDIPDGVEIEIREGRAAVMDIEDSNGNPISRETRVGFGYREPGDPLDSYSVISDIPVAPFRTLSLKDQQSGENAQRRRMNFDADRVSSGRLRVEDADTLALLAKGPDQIDATGFYFDYPAQRFQG